MRFWRVISVVTLPRPRPSHWKSSKGSCEPTGTARIFWIVSMILTPSLETQHMLVGGSKGISTLSLRTIDGMIRAIIIGDYLHFDPIGITWLGGYHLHDGSVASLGPSILGCFFGKEKVKTQQVWNARCAISIITLTMFITTICCTSDHGHYLIEKSRCDIDIKSLQSMQSFSHLHLNRVIEIYSMAPTWYYIVLLIFKPCALIKIPVLGLFLSSSPCMV